MLKYLAKKFKKKLLNLSLYVIKRHVAKQDDLFLYTYDRKKDLLFPVTWKARGITNNNDQQLKLTNNWEISNLSKFFKDRVVVDVGASLGATTVPFSDKAKIVYSFEPQSDNFLFLKDQIKIRNINNVKLFNVALTDFNGKASFFNRESHGVHSLGVHNKGKVLTQSEVKVMTLDLVWEKTIKEKISVLKIDVEGFESDVLRGARNLLKNKLIDIVIFEFSPRILKLRGVSIFEPIEILMKFDYEVKTMDGKNFVMNKKSIPKICDLIAFASKDTNDKFQQKI